jgi:hypothetical protein
MSPSHHINNVLLSPAPELYLLTPNSLNFPKLTFFAPSSDLFPTFVIDTIANMTDFTEANRKYFE